METFLTSILHLQGHSYAPLNVTSMQIVADVRTFRNVYVTCDFLVLRYYRGLHFDSWFSKQSRSRTAERRRGRAIHPAYDRFGDELLARRMEILQVGPGSYGRCKWDLDRTRRASNWVWIVRNSWFEVHLDFAVNGLARQFVVVFGSLE